MDAREEILGRITAALRDVPRGSAPDEAEVPWTYGVSGPAGDHAALFMERVADYQAVIERVPPERVADRVAAALAGAGAHRVVTPAGLTPAWLDSARTTGTEVIVDDGTMTAAELDTTDGVVTASALAIATTGTIVLDHARDQGRRALTLVPDVHVCIVAEDRLVGDVPEGVARLQDAVDGGSPLTWISGPSATSDIELDRVEGVHGPRTLHVLLVSAASEDDKSPDAAC